MKEQPLSTDDIELQLLVDALQLRYGYNFQDYSRASLKRRVNNFITEKNYARVTDCISDLVHDDTLFNDFINKLTVHATEMFRNPSFYLYLREQVLPILKTYPYVNIWSAGCSTGEEIYSLAIMLHEENLLERTKIYATDICPITLDKARHGIYSIEEIKNYTKNYQLAGGTQSFSDYYQAEKNSAIMSRFLKNGIYFERHNLVCEGPFCKMHMILCQNVLIYFNNNLQNNVIELFAKSSINNGFLCVGDKENIKLLEASQHFRSFSDEHNVFRRDTIKKT